MDRTPPDADSVIQQVAHLFLLSAATGLSVTVTDSTKSDPTLERDSVTAIIDMVQSVTAISVRPTQGTGKVAAFASIRSILMIML